ncbi:hypothetical protein N7532_011059 [Penicillium argentinense]|uniref:Uncharacterized protein n=1 Tax=Penicillium argentinense TaxID=1131581 RepID=A0A9W9EHV7_9EURO|nr:uncharacterized protein N7532_011059 [Penicillium argentinense]KAJ5082016.1 hypothetical protein N7532_011059 [Penicillium argentinense]
MSSSQTPAADQLAVAPFSLLKRGHEDKYAAREMAAAALSASVDQIEDMMPCTPMQAGLLAMTARKSGDYTMLLQLELCEATDTKKFQLAVEAVIEESPILRTRILDLPSLGLTQVIMCEEAKWAHFCDLDHCKRKTEEQSMGLGTPLQLLNIVVGEGENSGRYFVWNLHHAVYDGWSLDLILKRIDLHYTGEQTLSKPVGFPSFVKHVMQNNEVQAANRFWRLEFEDLEAQIFPFLPSPGYQPQADRLHEHRVTGIQWPSTNVTRETVIRGAWSLLAAHYTNASEVLFGTTISGRRAEIPGIEDIMGPTIATIPMRVEINWHKSVSRFLSQLQNQGASMRPFEQTGIQNIRKMGSDAEQACQFQTLLVVQPASKAGAFASGLYRKVTDYKDNSTRGKFNSYALAVVFHVSCRGFRIELSFDSNTLETKQAERMARQLEHIVRQICDYENGTARVGDIHPLSSSDLEDIWRWNDTVPAPVEECVHALIEKRCRLQPDATAIDAWNGKISYNELDRMSTRLAQAMVHSGVGRGTIVPLLFEKSMWMPVCMLAVMKAGAAGVAVDTSQPEMRQQFIVQYVKPQLALCSTKNKALAERLLDGVGVVAVDHQYFENTSAFLCRDGLLPEVQPTDWLYLNFTSGSTGTPKATIVTHQNFRSAIQYQQDESFFSPVSRVYDFASYSFDGAWSNFMRTISSGGCLCIPTEDERNSNLEASLNAMKVTYTAMTPSASRILDPCNVPSLQTLVLGGEPLNTEDMKRWAPKVNLKNVYGPSECTTSATRRDIQEPCTQAGNIGHALGAVTWVVEARGGDFLAPIGAIGELWIEGPLVGDGYLNDPAKTAASFMTSPHWLTSGTPGKAGRQGRLYKTGDLVRYSSDGSLIFVGRKDSQVKVRGQRVELEEVENHIQTCLRDEFGAPVASEVIHPKGSPRPILAAFIAIGETVNDDTAIVREKLHSFIDGLDNRLAARVPGYMIPSVYLPIDHIPRTTTQKIDRRRIREIGSSIPPEQLREMQNGCKEHSPPVDCG